MVNRYICIQDWMIEKLKLSGIELIIFATIFGFSQDGESKFRGSLSYLAKWSGCTINSVQNNLKKLVEKKYIIKEERFENGVKFCTYHANLGGIQNFGMGGIQNFCNNNIDNNNIDNNSVEQKEIDKKTSATKIQTYSDHYSNLNAREQYYMQIALKYGINMNTLQWEQVMQKFISLNAEKKASVFDFKKHFENWLKSDYGEKEKEKAIAAEKEKEKEVKQKNRYQL